MAAHVADLTGADIELAILGGANLVRAKLIRANLKRANLVGVRADHADFTEADLYYSRPGNGCFVQAVFQNASLERAIFRRANLRNADMRGIQGQANFENAILEGVKR